MREARVAIGDSAFEAMGIEALVSLCREAGIQDFEELVCHGLGAIVQVEVQMRIDEERLSSLECIDKWEHVGEVDETHLYVIAFTAPELPEDLADEMDGLIGTCNPVVTEHGATMSFVGPQKAIAKTVSTYETAGVSTDLQTLDVYEGRKRPIDELTDRQREVIQTAYDKGYYEVPREVTTGDIAAELGIDSSTVAEHLQRAERNLLSHHL